jgi:AP-3 complex subunit beta
MVSFSCAIAFRVTCVAHSSEDVVVSNAVVILKSLVQTQINPSGASSTLLDSPVSIVSKLAYRIDEIHHPQARACVVWLVGEYASAVPPVQPNGLGTSTGSPGGIALWAPDVLRRTARTFSEEVSTSLIPIYRTFVTS